MIVNPAIIVYGLIFLAVLLLVEGLYLVVFGKSISLNSRVNRRLDLLEKGGQREKVLEQLRKEASQHLKAKGIPLYSILASKAQKGQHRLLAQGPDRRDGAPVGGGVPRPQDRHDRGHTPCRWLYPS
jgi:hypothetical protein